MRLLAVILDLGRASEPVTETQRGLPRASEIPGVYIAIDSTRGEDVWMVSRKVDICDGAAMALQRVLDSATGPAIIT